MKGQCIKFAPTKEIDGVLTKQRVEFDPVKNKQYFVNIGEN